MASNMPQRQTEPRPLHLAKNMSELNQKSCPDSVKKQIKSSAAKSICNTASKSFQLAEDNYKNGDDESAFLYYMRYLESFKMLREKSEYNKSTENKKFYDSLIGPSKVKLALSQCEKLGDSLKIRYDRQNEIARLDMEMKQAEISDAAAEIEKRKALDKAVTKNGIVQPIKPQPQEETGGGMLVNQLKNYMEQKSTRFLVVDCRFASDYARSHLDYPNCISIPKEKLIPGSSAQRIYDELMKIPDNLNTSILWSKRADFDLIILYDWNSSLANRDPNEAIFILYDAITKWDPATKYKGKIYILQGGIRSLYYSYPQLLNNPAEVQEDISSKRVDPSKGLQSISYPSLEDDSSYGKSNSSRIGEKSPSPAPKLPPTHSIPTNGLDNNNFSAGRIDTVEIDRSKKPIKKYPSKVVNDVASANVNGFAKMNGMTSEDVFDERNTNEVMKSEDVGERLCKALDEVMHGTRDIVNKEEELKIMYGTSSLDANTNDLLKEKEKIIEHQAKELEKTKAQLEKMKLDYEESLRREKSTLPRIRATPVQTELENKQKGISELDAYVRRLREERKIKKDEKEKLLEDAKIHHMNGILVNEDESLGGASFPAVLRTPSSTTASVSRPTAPKPSHNSASGSTTSFGRPQNESSPIPINNTTTTRLRDDETPRNSLLKRSHSNPNFAQSLPEESPPNTPDFNRSQKPQKKPGRRWDEIESSEIYIQSDQNRTGLKNLGNTCYMNSIMQCLNHTHHFTNYFMRLWQKETVVSNPKSEITKEVAAAINEMNKGFRSIALNDLKSVILRKRPTFRPSEQQDSHEFLTLILQSLHEEAVDKSVAEKHKLPDLDKFPEVERAEVAWNHFMRTENTIVSKLFGGQYRSTVECANCQNSSVTFDTFFVLTVPIPSETKKCTINQCIDLSSLKEDLTDFKCTKCKRQGKAYKKLDIWRLPPYLIIHLQRFYDDGYWKKRLTEVEFPLDHLDVKAGLHEGLPKASRFQLFGVSNHYGTMEGGHYTAYCQRTSWSKYDDVDVFGIAARDVVTPAAYILFYKNRDFDSLLEQR